MDLFQEKKISINKEENLFHPEMQSELVNKTVQENVRQSLQNEPQEIPLEGSVSGKLVTGTGEHTADEIIQEMKEEYLKTGQEQAKDNGFLGQELLKLNAVHSERRELFRKLREQRVWKFQANGVEYKNEYQYVIDQIRKHFDKTISEEELNECSIKSWQTYRVEEYLMEARFKYSNRKKENDAEEVQELLFQEFCALRESTDDPVEDGKYRNIYDMVASFVEEESGKKLDLDVWKESNFENVVAEYAYARLKKQRLERQRREHEKVGRPENDTASLRYKKELDLFRSLKEQSSMPFEEEGVGTFKNEYDYVSKFLEKTYGRTIASLTPYEWKKYHVRELVFQTRLKSSVLRGGKQEDAYLREEYWEMVRKLKTEEFLLLKESTSEPFLYNGKEYANEYEYAADMIEEKWGCSLNKLTREQWTDEENGVDSLLTEAHTILAENLKLTDHQDEAAYQEMREYLDKEFTDEDRFTFQGKEYENVRDFLFERLEEEQGIMFQFLRPREQLKLWKTIDFKKWGYIAQGQVVYGAEKDIEEEFVRLRKNGWFTGRAEDRDKTVDELPERGRKQLLEYKNKLDQALESQKPFMADGTTYANPAEYVVKRLEALWNAGIDQLHDEELLYLFPGIWKCVEETEKIYNRYRDENNDSEEASYLRCERDMFQTLQHSEWMEFITEKLEEDEPFFCQGKKYKNKADYMLKSFNEIHGISYFSLSEEEQKELWSKNQEHLLIEMDRFEAEYLRKADATSMPEEWWTKFNESDVKQNRTFEELSQEEQKQYEEFDEYLSEALEQDQEFAIGGRLYNNAADYAIQNLEKILNVKLEDLSAEALLKKSQTIKEYIEHVTVYVDQYKEAMDDAGDELQTLIYQKKEEWGNKKKVADFRNYLKEQIDKDRPIENTEMNVGHPIYYYDHIVFYQNPMQYIMEKNNGRGSSIPNGLSMNYADPYDTKKLPDDFILQLDIDAIKNEVQEFSVKSKGLLQASMENRLTFEELDEGDALFRVYNENHSKKIMHKGKECSIADLVFEEYGVTEDTIPKQMLQIISAKELQRRIDEISRTLEEEEENRREEEEKQRREKLLAKEAEKEEEERRRREEEERLRQEKESERRRAISYRTRDEFHGKDHEDLWEYIQNLSRMCIDIEELIQETNVDIIHEEQLILRKQNQLSRLGRLFQREKNEVEAQVLSKQMKSLQHEIKKREEAQEARRQLIPALKERLEKDSEKLTVLYNASDEEDDIMKRMVQARYDRNQKAEDEIAQEKEEFLKIVKELIAEAILPLPKKVEANLEPEPEAAEEAKEQTSRSVRIQPASKDSLFYRSLSSLLEELERREQAKQAGEAEEPEQKEAEGGFNLEELLGGDAGAAEFEKERDQLMKEQARQEEEARQEEIQQEEAQVEEVPKEEIQAEEVLKEDEIQQEEVQVEEVPKEDEIQQEEAQVDQHVEVQQAEEVQAEEAQQEEEVQAEENQQEEEVQVEENQLEVIKEEDEEDEDEEDEVQLEVIQEEEEGVQQEEEAQKEEDIQQEEIQTEEEVQKEEVPKQDEITKEEASKEEEVQKEEEIPKEEVQKEEIQKEEEIPKEEVQEEEVQKEEVQKEEEIQQEEEIPVRQVSIVLDEIAALEQVEEKKEEIAVPKEAEKKAEGQYYRQIKKNTSLAEERGKDGYMFDYLQNWKLQKILAAKYRPERKPNIRTKIKRSPFVDVPAKQADTKGERQAEKKRTKRVQPYFADAGIVTVREYEQLTDWFASEGNEKLNSKLDSMSMDQLQNDLLTMEITPEKMTERYISSHIVELYQYSRKCREFARRLEEDAQNADYLNAQSALNRTRVEHGIILRGLSFAKYLDEHMAVHGIRMDSDGQPVLVDRKKKNKNRTNEIQDYKERQNVYYELLSDSRELEEEHLQKIVNSDFEIRMASMAKQKEGKEGFSRVQKELTADVRELKQKYPLGYTQHSKELDFLQARMLVFMVAGVNPVPEFVSSKEMTLFHQKMNHMIRTKSKQVSDAQQTALELAHEYRIAYQMLIGAPVQATGLTRKIIDEAVRATSKKQN